jgi:hypothetical protein
LCDIAFLHFDLAQFYRVRDTNLGKEMIIVVYLFVHGVYSLNVVLFIVSYLQLTSTMY